MAITLFDFKDWKDYYYKDLIIAFYNEYQKKQLQEMLQDEVDNFKDIRGKDISGFFSYRGELSSMPIMAGPDKGKHQVQLVAVKGQYSAIKFAAEKYFKPKPKKNIIDKFFTMLVLLEALKIHNDKNFRKLVGIKKGFFG